MAWKPFFSFFPLTSLLRPVWIGSSAEVYRYRMSGMNGAEVSAWFVCGSAVRQSGLYDADLGDRRHGDPELSDRRAPASVQEHRPVGRLDHVPRLRPPAAARHQARRRRPPQAQRTAQRRQAHRNALRPLHSFFLLFFGFGLWLLEFWALAFGFWGFGFGVLGFGFWSEGFGLWVLVFGFWVFRFWASGFRFWVLGLGFGLRVLGFGFWVMGCDDSAVLRCDLCLWSAVSLIR